MHLPKICRHLGWPPICQPWQLVRAQQINCQPKKQYQLCRCLPCFQSMATVKALLSPRGAYLISDLPEGGLNREGGLLERGGLFTKSKDKDIFDSFLVLSTQILRNQHTILRLKYINSFFHFFHFYLFRHGSPVSP